MSARDDYPYWPAPNDRRFSAEGAWHWSVAMDEIDRQRRWAAEAKASLDDWHSTLEPMIPEAFKDGRLGDRWPQVVADYITELQADLQSERGRSHGIARYGCPNCDADTVDPVLRCVRCGSAWWTDGDDA